MASVTLRYRINSVGVAAVWQSLTRRFANAQKSMANATLRYQKIT
jgi:hypothetical protein